MASSDGGARAALLLLELGKSGSHGASLQEVAEALRQTKPTLLRGINSLIDYGFVEQVSRGRYRLGPSIYALARAESAVALDVATWRRVLEKLADDFGQTIHLVRRAGLDVVVIDMQVGNAPVQALAGGIGGRLPMGIGSGSLAIMGTLDPLDQDAMLSSNEARYARFGLGLSRVSEIVKRASADGHSSDVGLIIPECGGIGVPIREPGRLAASMAITLSAPLEFFSKNQIFNVAKAMKLAIADNLKRKKDSDRRAD